MVGTRSIKCGKVCHWSSLTYVYRKNGEITFYRGLANVSGFVHVLLGYEFTWKFSLMRCGLKLFGITTTPRWTLKRKAICAAVLLYFLPMAFSTGSFSKGGEDTFTLEKKWGKKEQKTSSSLMSKHRGIYLFVDRTLHLLTRRVKDRRKALALRLAHCQRQLPV